MDSPPSDRLRQQLTMPLIRPSFPVQNRNAIFGIPTDKTLLETVPFVGIAVANCIISQKRVCYQYFPKENCS